MAKKRQVKKNLKKYGQKTKGKNKRNQRPEPSVNPATIVNPVLTVNTGPADVVIRPVNWHVDYKVNYI